jgi:hypothetical protein
MDCHIAFRMMTGILWHLMHVGHPTEFIRQPAPLLVFT